MLILNSHNHIHKGEEIISKELREPDRNSGIEIVLIEMKNSPYQLNSNLNF